MSLDRKNPMNFLHLAVLPAEFFLFASVCFHSRLRWSPDDAEGGDGPLVAFFRAIFSEALIGGEYLYALELGVKLGVLVVLLLLVATYLLLLGDAVYEALETVFRGLMQTGAGDVGLDSA